jgi:NAD(P)-dependent dehydrogenase (short-subunit alcohol dehydrogenase family)
VIAMKRQLAMEGGRHRIRVNSISPGLVRTGATAALIEDPHWFAPMKRKLMLNGQVGTPEDIAYCALYLASDEAKWVTGANFVIDGGTTAC